MFNIIITNIIVVWSRVIWVAGNGIGQYYSSLIAFHDDHDDDGGGGVGEVDEDDHGGGGDEVDDHGDGGIGQTYFSLIAPLPCCSM